MMTQGLDAASAGAFRGRFWVALCALVATAVQADSPVPDHVSGAEVYAATCSVCHGEDGRGAMWGRASLNPPPIDFTAADPEHQLTVQRMLASVTHGRPGTAMQGFGSRLSAAEIHAVIGFIRGTFMRPGTAHTDAGHSAHHQHAVEDPPAWQGDAAAGERFYRDNCAICHGEGGAGDGPRAHFIYPRPRHLAHPSNAVQLDRAHLFQAIKLGVKGREMPAWGKVLDDRQIADVAEYVYRSFIAPAARRATPQ